MKDLKPKKPKEKEQPWRETNNHNSLFDPDPKRLKGCALSNADIVTIYIFIT